MACCCVLHALIFSVDAHLSAARRFVLDWIAQQERDAAHGFVRRTYECDQVGWVDMDVSFVSMQTSPLYVPAFVFRSEHLGTKMRTYVSGAATRSCLEQQCDSAHVIASYSLP
jgi:hypothetical protein